MLLAPPSGQVYRDPATKQLVPEAGAEFDPLDLDVARAIACGDLVAPSAAVVTEAASADEEASAPPKQAPKAKAQD